MMNSRRHIEKVDRLSGVCLDNAIRLHIDSIRLFEMKSFASALALSILAMEELAKSFLYEDMAWHARVDGTSIDFSLDFTNKHIRSHKIKQRVFANQAIFPNYVVKDGKLTPTRASFWQAAQSDKLEIMKQQALYAGLTGSGTKATGSRIHNPLKISAPKPKKMITILNDYLLDLIIGVRGGWYSVDSESMNRRLSRSLLRRLKVIWLHRGKIGLKAIRLETKTHTA